MIDIYLNQTAIWKHTTGYNDYGEPIYTESTIKVRWEGKRQLVRDKQGQEVVSEARAFCKENIEPGDVLNFNGQDWVVITVSASTSLDGNVLFTEALL